MKVVENEYSKSTVGTVLKKKKKKRKKERRRHVGEIGKDHYLCFLVNRKNKRMDTGVR
jgi:hypothetical protein